MKRILLIALALVLALSLIACGSKEEPAAAAPAAEAPAEEKEPVVTEAPTEEPKPQWPETIVDVWVLSIVEMEGVTLNASDVGLSGTMDFRADGTVAIAMLGEEDQETYTVSGNNVTISDGTTDNLGVYDPESDRITFEMDGGKLVIVRGSSVPETAPASAPAEAVAATEADVIGTWNLSEARVSGISLPVSALGEISMSFIFNADGTATLISNGQNTDGLSWEIQDGKVVLSRAGTVLYEIAFDGTMLLLDEPNSGTTLCFSK